ncbi:DUF6516 family protein [Azospirillum sp. 11R-A]|uniref:toxin-antitoxin system TumE family protein n=1 Tax=Azospirillum sp. 11R-A TaxID=3111634 RepID=UPI003C15C2B5
MKATLLIRRRVAFGNRDFAELVVWRLPEPVPPTTHGFKYRLVYIVDGQRVVGFDNERGKGDHRHYGDVEESYSFDSVEQLVADFLDAVAVWRRTHGKA